MIRKRRSDDVLAYLRDTNPHPTNSVAASVTESDLARAMREAISAGDSPGRPIPVGDQVAMNRGAGAGQSQVGIHSRRRAVTVAISLVCAFAAAALLVLGGGTVGSVKDGGRPAFAAAAVKVAEANPRLLVTAPGWSIVHVHSFEVDSGILEYRYRHTPAYGPDAHNLHLSWHPAQLYPSTQQELQSERHAQESVVVGRRAFTFHSRRAGGSDFVTVLPPRGAVYLEISASLTPNRYAAVLRSLRAVGVDRWLAAMPAEVVRPVSRAAEITEMLRGVPLPPGFHSTDLEAESDLTVRFELGRAVASAVACGWLRSWQSATHLGDEPRAQEAVEEMADVRRWPVLLQMVREKGYQGNALPVNGAGWPSNVVAAAREIASGHLRRKPAVRTIVRHHAVVGIKTPKNAAPLSVLGCALGR